MKNKKRVKKYIILAVVIILFGIFAYDQNNHLVISGYDISSSKVPAGFEGFTIVHLSDLHDKNFGKDNSRLLDKVAVLEPDIIVITGDIVDNDHSNLNIAIGLAGKLANIAPTYYVNGNHEDWLSEAHREELYKGIREQGVIILDNKKEIINKGDDYINLLGLMDKNLRDGTLASLKMGEDEFNLLLAHEPQCIGEYALYGTDLVLSGHAHGGQFILPFIGAVVAPDQGFNPKYTQGVYERDYTQMVVSRGLGNSVIPLRLFNYPEIVCVRIHHN